MLCKIVEAHGGKLPDDILVVFANTGLEHKNTYKFVGEISKRICPVVWVEYLRDGSSNSYRVVDSNTCSVDGEPLAAVIGIKKYLPNPVMRFCTQECKIVPISKYAKSIFGNDEWTNVVGLRYDEPHRVHKLKDSSSNKDVLCPVYLSGHTINDVNAFWKQSDFDLELPMDNPSFGNCVGCFLKGQSKRMNAFRMEPEYADWWIRMEERMNATFRSDALPYRHILDMALNQGTFDFDALDIQECNCTD